MKIFGLNITRENRDINGVKTQVPDAVVSNPYGAGGLGLLFNQYKGGQATNLSAFFRGASLIADSVASIPIQVKKENADGYSDIFPRNYLLDLFDNNENNITRFEMIKYLIWSVILKGNGYIYIYRDNTGKAKGLRWLPSESVTINYNQLTNDLYYLCPLVSNKKIEPVNLLHVKLYSDDGINGRSVISYSTRAIKAGNAAENSAINYYGNGGNLNGIIKADGTLTPQQKQDIRDSWRSSIEGGVAVLQGNLSYTPIQMNAEEAQLLETRQFTVQDISRWLGINPVLLGDLTHSSYNTLEQAQLELLTHTLLPYISIIEQEFTRKLFVPSEKKQGFYINLDENEILRADKTKQVDYFTSLIDKGVLSINEVRKALGYQEIEGGDRHTIPYTDINQNDISGENNENKEE